MSAIENNTSNSGYWEVRINDNDSSRIEELRRLASTIFHCNGKMFYYSPNELSSHFLDMKKVEVIPLDKYVACRSAIEGLLKTLSFVCVEIYHASFSNPTRENIYNIKTYDIFVTDPSVNSIILVPPETPTA